MKLENLIRSITPEIYTNLKTALELGRWPDGTKLTREQKEHCMQAIMHYENLHDFSEGERLGFIDRSKKEAQDEAQILSIPDSKTTH
ncbi:hypothetical protein OLMES_4264 [Oleiphilus messinensis]|uniref:DUF1315 domain-containing protein n=1 Tax=Oleiphilus messinensis TaxID=141451 RepID=A0A1Y0IDN7_9GAMM|nr:DUF1315 family protein [Oleiphilus messinensis]ARU58279.1 hypothetical protein OLMES_4264 [Oleiphilus messinensis]